MKKGLYWGFWVTIGLFIFLVVFLPTVIMIKSPDVRLVELIPYFSSCILLLGFFVFTSGRIVELNAEGCTVKLLFIKRFYAWEELTTKRIVENEHLLCGGREYVRFVVFTKKKKFRAPTVFSVSVRTLIPRPLSYIVIGLGSKEALGIHTDALDEEIFYEKMKEWGVVLEKPIPYYKTNPPV